MIYHLEFRLYSFPFTTPLVTSHGSWEVRSGIILKLWEKPQKITYGEIAPIPWFGSETLEAALKFCQELPSQITSQEIENIPDRLPATQFGFSSAIESLEFLKNSPNPLQNTNFSYLLPTGKTALNAWQKPWQDGYRTFKWKIGVSAPEQELEQLRQLINTLPPGAKLRLDANGSLNLAEAHLWLQECDRLNIEFLEQPLPVDNFQDLLTLAEKYRTSIALDESVATTAQLEACYAQGWKGIYVIKPSIAGYSDRLRSFCRSFNIDAVFSSSLETAIGRTQALRLAQELSNPQRAVGFGVDQWLNISSKALIQQLWQEP